MHLHSNRGVEVHIHVFDKYDGDRYSVPIGAIPGLQRLVNQFSAAVVDMVQPPLKPERN